MAQRLITLVFAIFAIGVAPASAGDTPIASHGETRVAARIGDAKVVAAFLTHQVAIGAPSDPRPERRLSSCTYSRYPCSITDAVEIAVDGHPVFVPRSVFADLTDINTARIHQAARGRFELTLGGGDASESYIAEIQFDRRKVRLRVLTAAEMHEILERTYYSGRY